MSESVLLGDGYPLAGAKKEVQAANVVTNVADWQRKHVRPDGYAPLTTVLFAPVLVDVCMEVRRRMPDVMALVDARVRPQYVYYVRERWPEDKTE